MTLCWNALYNLKKSNTSEKLFLFFYINEQQFNRKIVHPNGHAHFRCVENLCKAHQHLQHLLNPLEFQCIKTHHFHHLISAQESNTMTGHHFHLLNLYLVPAQEFATMTGHQEETFGVRVTRVMCN